MNVQTYLFFDGCCEQAIELYGRALGAEILHLSRFSQVPNFPQPPNGGELVFHATIRIGETMLNLSDDPKMERGPFGGFAFLVHFDSPQGLDRALEGLADGGQIQVAATKTMWAERYGIVADRFGIVWKLQYS